MEPTPCSLHLPPDKARVVRPVHRHAHPADDGRLPVMEAETAVDEAVRRPVRRATQQGAPPSHMAVLLASRTGL